MPELENYLSPQEILEQQYGLKFTWSSTEVPVLVNYNALVKIGVDTDQAKQYTEYVLSFINLPMIEDQFGTDHRARREWEASLDPHLQQILSQNKLGKNMLFRVYGVLESIVLDAEHYGHNQNPLFDKILSWRNQLFAFLEQYNNLDLDSKKEVVHTAEQIGQQFLTLFASTGSESGVAELRQAA